MISKILSTKKTHYANYAKQNMWLVIMSLAVTGFATVIPAFVMGLSSIADGKSMSISLMFVNNTTLRLLSISLAFVVGSTVFKYLNSKPEVDLYHGVPLKKSNIFLTRYSFGLISFVIPLIFNLLLMYVMSILFKFTDIPTITNIFELIFDISIRFTSVYSFVTLATIVTGNMFMSVCTSLGFMNAPFVIWWMIVSTMSTFLKFFAYSEMALANIAYYTNPIFNVYTAVTYYSVGADYLVADSLVYFVQAVIMFGLSYISFMKRKSENSANPVAINIFKPIIKGLGVFSASILGGNLFNLFIDENILVFLFGAFLVGIIIHIAFEMLFENDIRAGFKNLWHFGVLFSGLTLFVVVITLDLTGYNTRIEPISNISSIEYHGIQLKEQENIEILHNYMQIAVSDDTTGTDDVKNYSSKFGQYGVELTVNLSDGSSYKRYYKDCFLSLEESIEIETSPEFFMQAFGYDESVLDLSTNETDMWKRPYIDLNNDIKTLSNEQVQTLYNLAVSQSHLITPEYLEENHPLFTVRYYNQLGWIQFFPVFSIQTDAVNYADLDAKVDVSGIKASAMGKSEYFDTRMSEEIQTEIIENMTKIYGYSGHYSGYYNSHYKDIVFIYDEDSYNEIGYMTFDKFMEIVE